MIWEFFLLIKMWLASVVGQVVLVHSHKPAKLPRSATAAIQGYALFRYGLRRGNKAHAGDRKRARGSIRVPLIRGVGLRWY